LLRLLQNYAPPGKISESLYLLCINFEMILQMIQE